MAVIASRAEQRTAILAVLDRTWRHPSDFSGHYRRRWSILDQLVREGVAERASYPDGLPHVYAYRRREDPAGPSAGTS